MKKKYKIILGVIIFVLSISIFSDWKNLKAGLYGKPPVVGNCN